MHIASGNGVDLNFAKLSYKQIPNRQPELKFTRVYSEVVSRAEATMHTINSYAI